MFTTADETAQLSATRDSDDATRRGLRRGKGIDRSIGAIDWIEFKLRETRLSFRVRSFAIRRRRRATLEEQLRVRYTVDLEDRDERSRRRT
jgi:hypothetical protein